MTNRKTNFIIVRVTEEDKKELQKKAQDYKNVSEYVRHELGLD